MCEDCEKKIDVLGHSFANEFLKYIKKLEEDSLTSIDVEKVSEVLKYRSAFIEKTCLDDKCADAVLTDCLDELDNVDVLQIIDVLEKIPAYNSTYIIKHCLYHLMQDKEG